MNENRERAVILLLCVMAAGLLVAPNFVGNFLLISTGVACALNEDRVREIGSRMPQWTICLAAPMLIIAMRLSYTRFSGIGYAIAACLIAGALMTSLVGTSRLTAMLSSGWLVAIGRSSYGIYLWQQLATYAFPGADAWFYAASIGFCVVAAMISYRYFESRWIAFGRSLSAGLIKAPRPY